MSQNTGCELRRDRVLAVLELTRVREGHTIPVDYSMPTYELAYHMLKASKHTLGLCDVMSLTTLLGLHQEVHDQSALLSDAHRAAYTSSKRGASASALQHLLPQLGVPWVYRSTALRALFLTLQPSLKTDPVIICDGAKELVVNARVDGRQLMSFRRPLWKEMI